MSGYVHVISDGSPHLKIGRTSRTTGDRVREYQTGNPERLRVLFSWWTEDEVRDEWRMHRLLGAYRYHDEWFTVSEKQVVEAWRVVAGGFSATFLAARVLSGVRRWGRRLVRWGWNSCAGLGLLVVVFATANALV